MKRRRKSEATRQRILEAALAKFRKHGFDATTMRDIAESAGTSLGSTYYYFPSKEALVLAHWEAQMDEHERRAREVFSRSGDLGERVRAVFHARLDLMKNDRKLLTGLFRTIGDPSSSVSVFSGETTSLRDRGIGLLREALSIPEVTEDLRDQAALGLWALMLGVVLYFVHDDSKGQSRTRRLVDGALDTLVPLLPWLAAPAAEPLRTKIFAVLTEAGLWQKVPERDTLLDRQRDRSLVVGVRTSGKIRRRSRV